MECALVEPEEQTIPRFLKGLKPEIVILSNYNLIGLMVVCKFALKEKPQKEVKGGGFQLMP